MQLLLQPVVLGVHLLLRVLRVEPGLLQLLQVLRGGRLAGVDVLELELQLLPLALEVVELALPGRGAARSVVGRFLVVVPGDVDLGFREAVLLVDAVPVGVELGRVLLRLLHFAAARIDLLLALRELRLDLLAARGVHLARACWTWSWVSFTSSWLNRFW